MNHPRKFWSSLWQGFSLFCRPCQARTLNFVLEYIEEAFHCAECVSRVWGMKNAEIGKNKNSTGGKSSQQVMFPFRKCSSWIPLNPDSFGRAVTFSNLSHAVESTGCEFLSLCEDKDWISTCVTKNYFSWTFSGFQERHWLLPIGSMYGIYTNIGGLLTVNVTIYSTHGSYGLVMKRCRSERSQSFPCGYGLELGNQWSRFYLEKFGHLVQKNTFLEVNDSSLKKCYPKKHGFS